MVCGLVLLIACANLASLMLAILAWLVLAGVLSPLELPVADTANFLGYVLWSLWLIAFGAVILVRERRGASAPSTAAVAS